MEAIFTGVHTPWGVSEVNVGPRGPMGGREGRRVDVLPTLRYVPADTVFDCKSAIDLKTCQVEAVCTCIN